MYVLSLSGHKDSVVCTEFSSDGKYLATGDLSGGIRVWEVDERRLVCSFEASDLEVRGRERERRKKKRNGRERGGIGVVGG